MSQEFDLGVLWAAWWLHHGHGEDTYAEDFLIETFGANGIARTQRLAAREDYRFRRGFWAEVKRKARREEEFLASMCDRRDRGRPLSDRQADILERIYAERTP